MMRKLILSIYFLLLILLGAHSSLAATYLNNGGSTLSDYDQAECGIFDRGIANYTKDTDFTFKKPSALVWLYTASDAHGTSGVCWSGVPTVNNRFTIKRTGGLDNIQYVLREDYCVTRVTAFYPDTQGYCGSGGYNDGYTVTFGTGEVVSRDSDKGNKTMWDGGAPGTVVCLKRIKAGEQYLHTTKDYDVNGTNDTGTNQVCAYKVNPGSDMCNTPFVSWDNAYLGCVAEIPPPGPDVINSVLPTTLSPYVDEKLCMDDKGNGRNGCDPSKPNLVGIGSTFDKPIVPLTDGKSGRLYLQYQFNGDIAANPKYPACSNFAAADPKAFDITTVYCAQVPVDDPSKVCACIRRSDGIDPLSLPEIDYCGSTAYIGCVDRPTLEHSKLALASEYVNSTDTLRGTIYPAIRPVFARTNAFGKILYVDETGADACLNDTDKLYYKCDAGGTPSTTPSTGKITFKERLALPKPEVKIKEFIPDYPPATVTCKDATDKTVVIDYNGEYYALGADGKMSADKASGTVTCTGPTGALTLSKAKPQSYTRDSSKVYGINFQSMIPAIDPLDNTIKFGRYTSARDALGAERVCTPLKSQGLCTDRGTLSFFPAGGRDTTYCNIEDLTSPQCAGYRVVHDQLAIPLYCPGYFTEATNAGGSKICLYPNSKWKFRTVAEYKEQISVVNPSDILALACQTKQTDDLCNNMELICKKSPVPVKRSGLLVFNKDLAYDGLSFSNCDPQYGLLYPFNYFLYLSDASFSKDEICKSLPSGKTCDQYYDEFLADASVVQNKLKEKRNELMSVFFINMEFEDGFAIPEVTALYRKYLPGKIATLWQDTRQTSIFRRCKAGGYQEIFNYFTLESVNCVMKRDCTEIIKAAEHTGFATWPKANIDAVVKDPTTVTANKGKSVDFIIKGVCGSGYAPKTGTTAPTRTCTVTYKADGTIDKTRWKLAIDTPCVPN